MQGNNTGAGPTFQSIHGSDTNTIQASDLRLDRFVSESELADWHSAAPAAALPSAPAVVVLTGANGFLGRFLLLELLQRTAYK